VSGALDDIRATLAAAASTDEGTVSLSADLSGAARLASHWVDVLNVHSLTFTGATVSGVTGTGTITVAGLLDSVLGPLQAVAMLYPTPGSTDPCDIEVLVVWSDAMALLLPAEAYLAPPSQAIPDSPSQALLRGFELHNARAMFSTFDFASAPEAVQAAPDLPPWLDATIPAAGLTVVGALHLPDAAAGVLAPFIGTLSTPTVSANVDVAVNDLWITLVHVYDVNGAPSFAPFGDTHPEAALTRLELGLPIDGWGFGHARAGLSATLIDGGTAMDIELELDLVNKTASLSAAAVNGKAPSLDWMIAALCFGQAPALPFDLGCIVLQKLGAVFDLATMRLADYSAQFSTSKPITLFDSHVTLTPTISLEVGVGKAEVVLTGVWTLGTCVIDTMIDFDTGDVSATLAEGEVLDLGDFLKDSLPSFMTAELALIDLELNGNYLKQTFDVELETAQALAITIEGQVLALEDIVFELNYQGGSFAASASGTLVIFGITAGIRVAIDDASARITFGIVALDLGEFAQLFLSSIGSQIDLGHLTLVNLAFALAHPGPTFNVHAELAEPILIAGSATWALKHAVFNACRSAPGPQGLSATFSGDFAFGGISFSLEANYADAAACFIGSTDASIEIDEIADALQDKLGLHLPPCVATGISVRHIAASIWPKSKRLLLSCTGELAVHGTTLAIDLSFDVEPGSVTVSGALHVGSQAFKLTFTSGAQSALTASWSGNATFSDMAQGLGLEPDAIALPAELQPTFTGAELTWNGSAILLGVTAADFGTGTFTTVADHAGRAYALFMDMDHFMDIDLASLPVVGPMIAASGDIALSRVTLLAATRAFTAAELNAAFTGQVGAPAGRDMPAGLAVETSLVFAGTSAQLTLPLSAPACALAVATAASPTLPGPTPDDATKWMDVHRTFGPVRLDRIGLRYNSGVLSVMFEAGMAIGMMEVALDGLGFGSRMDHFSPSFSLQGLGVQYQSGPITLAGGLLHTKESYDGTLQISTEAVSLALLGRYTPGPGRASLFVFGILDEPTIGGPPYFFVQGLAVGLGYNNRLNLPSLQGVPDFSLVKAAFPAQNPFASPTDLTAVLANMGTDFQDEPGEYWLAAGVRFSSFELVESFALVTAEFGNKLLFSILGLSQVSIPPGAQDPLVFAEIAIEATLDPEAGVLKVLGQLTNNSYVLSRSCRLGGGFAYCVWFVDGAGARAGDFVYTQGGYHPSFNTPDHYPVVPRLTLDWQVDDNLSVTGQAYFAVTPGCLMAGGTLSAVYECGSIRAWFDCSADFLLSWKPFRYEADIGCSVGVSFTLHLLFCSTTISVSVGVSLHLEGPEFGGTVHIDLRVVSFSISFGADSPAGGYLHWDEFSTSFLRAPPPAPAALSADLLPARTGVVMAAATAGLLRDFSATAGPAETRWVFQGEQLAIAINTPIPAKQAIFNAIGVDATTGAWSAGACIAPMGVDAGAFESVLTLTLEIHEDAEGWVTCRSINPVPIRRSLPASLWLPSGSARPGPLDGLPSGAPLLEDALAGFMLSKSDLAPDTTCEVDIEAMNYEAASTAISFGWAKPASVTTDYFAVQVGPDHRLSFHAGDLTVSCENHILSAISTPGAVAARTAAVAAMVSVGLSVDPDIEITTFGNETVLNDWPRICLLGEEQPQHV
jgi:hypothetical protein